VIRRPVIRRPAACYTNSATRKKLTKTNQLVRNAVIVLVESSQAHMSLRCQRQQLFQGHQSTKPLSHERSKSSSLGCLLSFLTTSQTPFSCVFGRYTPCCSHGSHILDYHLVCIIGCRSARCHSSTQSDSFSSAVLRSQREWQCRCQHHHLKSSDTRFKDKMLQFVVG
jgi:hypothetical protein